MANNTLEERLGTLETRMDMLQNLMKEKLTEPPSNAKRGWKAVVGSFAEDPLYEDAMRLGRKWRRSERIEGDEESR